MAQTAVVVKICHLVLQDIYGCIAHPGLLETKALACEEPTAEASKQHYAHARILLQMNRTAWCAEISVSHGTMATLCQEYGLRTLTTRRLDLPPLESEL